MRKGSKHSLETRKKLSLSHMGHKPPRTAFQKGFTPWNKGIKKRTNTGKTHFKIGHKPTKEWIEIMKIKMRGRKQSKETIEKRVSQTRNDKHWNWKGDDVGYMAVHNWVRKWKGEPDTCEKCGKTGLTGRQIHWANIDHEYKRLLDDYIRLCAKCHYVFDKVNNPRYE